MLALQYLAVSGHYSIPGQPVMGGTCCSARTVPPATLQGCLEATVGAQYQTFQGRYAYGELHPPRGHGYLYCKRHYWGSGGMGRKWPDGRACKDKEIIRPVYVETWFDVAYCVLVEGPWEDRLRAALRGEIQTTGVLYLGTSEDLVHWVAEMTDPLDVVDWVVPGTKLRLPIKSGRGYNRIDAVYGTFDLRPGKPHWFEI